MNNKIRLIKIKLMKNNKNIRNIKAKIKKFPYLQKIIIFSSRYAAKVIDFIFIPVAIIYDRMGINVFEAKTRSFGHHLFEPTAVVALNNSKPKSNQKKLILLADQEKAYVKYTNTLLKQKFKVIEKYSFLNIYYWLARNEYCGLSKSSKYKEELDIFYDIHFKFRNKLDFFDHSELLNNEELNMIFNELNPENRYVVIWKPKIHRDDKYSFYSPLRYSSLENCKPLFDEIYEDGGIVFGLLYGETNFNHHAVIDLRKIENKLQREKFCFYLDLKCRYGILGQNGGNILLHLFNKPFIVYDVSYPYTLNFLGPKTLISLKEAIYQDGEPARLEDLISLKIKDVKKIIKDETIIFKPNTASDLIDIYKEFRARINSNCTEFNEKDYKINVEWGDQIPKNIYNNFCYSQIANCCYEKQYLSLAPKNLLGKKS